MATMGLTPVLQKNSLGDRKAGRRMLGSCILMGVSALLLFALSMAWGAQPTKEPAGAACEIRQEKTVTMPPRRSQDSTGFCYAFSATALIQHRYCKTKGGCQFSPTDPTKDDRLSVLDAVILANHGSGGLVHGGRAKDVLESVRREGGLAKETCGPFTVFTNNERPLPRESIPAFQSHFKKAFARFQEGYDECPASERRRGAAHLKTILGLTVEIDEIIRAMEYREPTIAQAHLFFPAECRKQRVRITDFGKVEPLVGDDFEDVRNKIIEMIGRGTPLNTQICAFQPSSAAAFKDRSSADVCGLHALVISGVRDCCIGDVCSKEYQFYDSSTLTFRGVAKPGNWVSEEVYRERLQRKWEQTKLRENLLWLE